MPSLEEVSLLEMSSNKSARQVDSAYDSRNSPILDVKAHLAIIGSAIGV